MGLDDPLTIAIIVVGGIIVCLIIAYAMRKLSKKEEKVSEERKSEIEF